jgi:hypothetical protein
MSQSETILLTKHDTDDRDEQAGQQPSKSGRSKGPKTMTGLRYGDRSRDMIW